MNTVSSTIQNFASQAYSSTSAVAGGVYDYVYGNVPSAPRIPSLTGFFEEMSSSVKAQTERVWNATVLHPNSRYVAMGALFISSLGVLPQLVALTSSAAAIAVIIFSLKKEHQDNLRENEVRITGDFQRLREVELQNEDAVRRNGDRALGAAYAETEAARGETEVARGEIKRLQAEVQKGTSLHQQFLIVKDREIVAMQEELVIVRQQSLEARTEKSAAESEVDELKAQLREAEGLKERVDDLVEELQTSKRECICLREKLSEMGETVGALLTELNKELVKSKAQYDDSKAQVKKLTVELTAMTRENEALNRTLGTTNETIVQLRADLDAQVSQTKAVTRNNDPSRSKKK
ncbi:MAG TPA: hypothetical protein VJK48_03870 [Chlamydiales bacterium]|nr:hypothetical protein [Chlamydiales bacterium]